MDQDEDLFGASSAGDGDDGNDEFLEEFVFNLMNLGMQSDDHQYLDLFGMNRSKCQNQGEDINNNGSNCNLNQDQSVEQAASPENSDERSFVFSNEQPKIEKPRIELTAEGRKFKKNLIKHVHNKLAFSKLKVGKIHDIIREKIDEEKEQEQTDLGNEQEQTVHGNKQEKTKLPPFQRAHRR